MKGAKNIQLQILAPGMIKVYIFISTEKTINQFNKY